MESAAGGFWACTCAADEATAADGAACVDVVAGAGAGAGGDANAVAGVDADVVGAFALVGETADKPGAGAGRLGVARQMISVPLQRGCPVAGGFRSLAAWSA